MRDQQDHSPTGRNPGQGRPRGLAFKAAAVLLTLASVVTGVACWLRTPDSAGVPSGPGSSERGEATSSPPTSLGPPEPFHGWTNPELVLLLSGQQHGYLGPCGCSRPQFGGLERRYNLLDQLRKERGWTVLPLELGDIPQRKGPASLPNVQGLLKYTVSMKALQKMGYAAANFGEYEASLSLFDVFASWTLNHPNEPPLLAANLTSKDLVEVFKLRRWHVVEPRKGLKVGIVGSIGPGVEDRIKQYVKDNSVTFGRGDDALPNALQEMMRTEKPDLRILLYQGSVAEARACAKTLTDLHIIFCLAEEDEPPSRPEIVGGTQIVRVGHKGKNVGVVGLFPTQDQKRPFDIRYQLIPLGEEYMTPREKEDSQPIVRLMEEYTKELKAENYLARYPQVTHQVQYGALQLPEYKDQEVKYAGSESCKSCHEHAYEVWEKSAHSHAYQTLVDAKHPSLRQYDGECIVCHTVGFGYKTGFTNAEKTAHLKDVGCESCHGPSYLHRRNPNDERLYKLINPYKGNPTAIEQMCMKCHDQDNDVHWNFDKWVKKHIIHMNPE